MFSGAKNSKKQGDIGLGVAIGWFTAKGYTVCVPLTDSQEYDLVVDGGDGLQRVQVKTTSFRKASGAYYVSLSVKGGNRTATGKIKQFDASLVDSVFVVTEAGTKYLIPSNRIDAKHAICLGDDKDEFKI